MESKKIMDRLVCGDVGFGKTEIAIRAAFKAVQDNKQVAYLVPTTVLAQQHYKTFAQRFKDFPVRVEMLSRFRTKANISQTIRDMKKILHLFTYFKKTAFVTCGNIFNRFCNNFFRQ